MSTTQFTDTNPGRPNGPVLSVGPGWLVFPLPGQTLDALGTSMLTDSGLAGLPDYGVGDGCRLDLPYGGDQSWWPTGQAVFCPPTTGSGEAKYPATESLVNQVIADVQHGVSPIYVVNWDPNDSSSCNVAIYPSGQIKYAPDFQQECAKLSIKVTGSN